MDNFIEIVKTLLPVGEKTTSSDFSIATNVASVDEIECLVFLDSRGKKSLDDGSEYMAAHLAQVFRAQETGYLILTRTHASTTYFTLVNFLRLLNSNRARGKMATLITNVGFVDLTPKKESVIDDLLLQADAAFPGLELSRQRLEDHILSNGETSELFTLDLEPVATLIAEQIAVCFQRCILVGTHEIPSHVRFSRERPATFYSQLKKTNMLLSSLESELSRRSLAVGLLDPNRGCADLSAATFDGVHLSFAEHKRLSLEISRCLDEDGDIAPAVPVQHG